ncbi:MAG TPA: prepilin-type N-terminal cleavage/methylation domain-containing protein [Gemmatimonadales bacterium]|nr:prepilin-type N-terminal cleavage/methylation domain-containing protein [Gemmatimonadales bacterium]
MRRSPAGFTLIELMVVIVVLGLLASIAVIRYGKVKEQAVIISLKSDLQSVANLEGLFKVQYDDFAGGTIAAGVPDTSRGGAGQIRFAPSEGNSVAITYRGTDGFSAIATSPGTTQQCGIFLGPSGYAPNAAVTHEGTAFCW